MILFKKHAERLGQICVVLRKQKPHTAASSYVLF